jgi:predicted alpha/beta-hydrolase family hydrolase
VSAGDSPRAVILLGHGAGGDATAPALLAVRDGLVRADLAVALLDQPYRVAGRRAPDPAAHLDAVAVSVVERVRGAWKDLPLVVGGKSSGARVGCRVAEAVGAVGVIALGFPLRPPGHPDRSRAAELAAGVPVLVVQGERDSFGTPDDVRSAAGSLPVTVHGVAAGDHSFVPRKADGRTRQECLAEVATVCVDWVVRLVGG